MSLDKSPEGYRQEQALEARRRGLQNAARRRASLEEVQARQRLELEVRHVVEDLWPPLTYYDRWRATTAPALYLGVRRQGVIP